MNDSHFDGLTRILVQSRRSLLGGALALAGGWFANVDTDARSKRKKQRRGNRKKNRQLVLNQDGCVDVGKPCRGDSNNCCSGICEGVAPRKGKRDRSRCVAHNASICGQSSDFCTTGRPAACHGSKAHHYCMLTSGGAPFCADFSQHLDTGMDASFYCRDCHRDTDCQAEFGPGAACVAYDGICSIYCGHTGHRACMAAGD